MKTALNILGHIYWYCWIALGLLLAWGYYFAFRIRDAWREMRK